MENIQNIQNQTLWYNSHIKIDKITLVCTDWFNKGIRQIEDLWGENSKLLTLDELRLRYELKETDWLRYQQLTSAIPKEWLVEMNKTEVLQMEIQLDPLLDMVVTSPKCSKAIYTRLQDLKIPSTQANVWSNTFQFELSPDRFIQNIHDAVKLVKATRFKNFIIKLFWEGY